MRLNWLFLYLQPEGMVLNCGSTGQIYGVLTFVSWRKNWEFGLQLYNNIGESKLLSQKLSLIGVVAFLGVKVEVDKSVRKYVPVVVNMVTMKEWSDKFLDLFESGSTYGKSDFLRKMKVCHKEVDWKVPV